MSATRTAWIGAFGIALLASTAAWALPSVPVSRAAVTAAPELLLIRHHHRHGHWRHRRSYALRDEEPEAARPGGDAPAALLPPPIDRPAGSDRCLGGVCHHVCRSRDVGTARAREREGGAGRGAVGCGAELANVPSYVGSVEPLAVLIGIRPGSSRFMG